MRRLCVRILPFLACALFLPSCDDGTDPDPDPAVPASIGIVTGDDQIGEIGEELPVALTVRVTDEDGAPIAGQLVHFVVTEGGGSVVSGAHLTGHDGTASDRWVLGTVTGDSQRVVARAIDDQGEGALSAEFTALVHVTVPAPVLWLKADELEAVNGAGLSTWPDAGPEGHDAVQPNAEHRPTFVASGINGLGSVRFTENCGINAPLTSCSYQYLTIPGMGDEFDEGEATLFVVAAVSDLAYAIYATGESQAPQDCGATFCDGYWRFQGNPEFWGNGDGFVGTFHRSRIDQWPLNTPSTGTHLFVLRSGSLYEFLIDGVGPTPASADFATGDAHSIGAADLPSDGSTQAQRFFNGMVGEVLVFDVALDNAQMAVVAADLAEKWGL